MNASRSALALCALVIAALTAPAEAEAQLAFDAASSPVDAPMYEPTATVEGTVLQPTLVPWLVSSGRVRSASTVASLGDTFATEFDVSPSDGCVQRTVELGRSSEVSEWCRSERDGGVDVRFRRTLLVGENEAWLVYEVSETWALGCLVERTAWAPRGNGGPDAVDRFDMRYSAECADGRLQSAQVEYGTDGPAMNLVRTWTEGGFVDRYEVDERLQRRWRMAGAEMICRWQTDAGRPRTVECTVGGDVYSRWEFNLTGPTWTAIRTDFHPPRNERRVPPIDVVSREARIDVDEDRRIRVLRNVWDGELRSTTTYEYVGDP